MSEDTDALFLGLPHEDRDGYQPILAFETRGTMTMFVPGSTESIDPRISTFLAGGFELLGDGDLRFPILRDWNVVVDEDSFAVVDPKGLPSYSVELSEVTPKWLEMVRRESGCIVITGTGLFLDPATFTWDRIDAASCQACVVGAIVPLRPARRGRRRGLLQRMRG